jgi:acyl-CoA thioester hydrolase
MTFTFHQTVIPEWIDENSHMRDAYFGLIYSMAGEAMQHAIGFDRAYRQETGCTIYLLEDHKYFRREVKLGADVEVKTHLLDFDRKRFHLHLSMYSNGHLVSGCEFMELHVNTMPTPKAAPIPKAILTALSQAKVSPEKANHLPNRSRNISLPKLS